MKKVLLYSLMLLSSVSFWSCKEDDSNIAGGENTDRLFRPMFRCDNNTGKGDNDPYNCTVTDYNTAQLFWYLIDDAVAYEIKWASQGNVANGEDAWIETEKANKLLGHVVVSDPKEYHLAIEHLNYQYPYRFAIRALNSFDATGYANFQGKAGVYDILNSGDAAWKNDSRNSLWYGYGGGREWADFLHLDTQKRPGVPFVIQVSDITKTSMHLTLNRSVATGYSADDLKLIRSNFNFMDADETILKIDYLTFTASASTPTATVNPQYVKYDIPEEAWGEDNILELDIEGLSENSCYDIDVWDGDIAIKVDACYNTTMKRTKGTPGEPILIKHVPNATATIGEGTNANTYDISSYNSMQLDDIITDYYTNTLIAENQVYYLEGGKAYHFNGSLDLYKGFTLRTNPEDVAQGKRAKLYMSGMTQTGNEPNTCNFMLGRRPEAGENASITLDIDSIRFMDLDVACPMALNYGDEIEGHGKASGNYFMNMHSTGMGINVTLVEWNNCTFQGFIRGFFRVQGSNDFFVQEMKLIDCEFYNCGYYSNTAGDYAYIWSDLNGKPKCNILKNVEIAGNVFYNTPKRPLITDNNKNVAWDASVRWNIDVHHNTFVNFCTVATNPILYTGYIPGGSVLGFHDNVIIVTKDPADVNRTMKSAGWDARNIQGGDGSGECIFNIYNNWTTANEGFVSNGYPFETNAFNATSNSPGKWYGKWNDAVNYPNAELEVFEDKTLTASELMISPNPTHFINVNPHHLDYHTDNGIDGLYYQQTEKVINSAIYNSGAGAPRLKNGKK